MSDGNELFGGVEPSFDDKDMVVGGFQDMFAGGAKKVSGDYDSYGVYNTSTKKTKGRYISKTPAAAAKKAARRLFKEASKGTRELTVYIRKTTRGSKREIYRYKAVLEVLKNPQVINKTGVEVKHKVKVVSEDLPPSVAAVANAKKDMEKEKMMKKKQVLKAKRAKAAEKARVKKTKAKKAKKPKTAKKSKTGRKGTKKSKRMTGGGCGMGSCTNLYV